MTDKAMPAVLAIPLAILILGALVVLGWINSSPRPRRCRRYALSGAREILRRPRESVVFGRAL